MPYQRGEVVYVPFQYSELSGGKVRPAIVVNSAEFQAAEQLYIVAAVTSNVAASSLGHRIPPKPGNVHATASQTRHMSKRNPFSTSKRVSVP
jgi:mRNA-degrading endonuclease toxin of MazEF toxin-antitoxin module